MPFRSSASRSGFTLVEIMVVVAIILILIGITAGVMNGVKDAQNESLAKGEMEGIALGLDKFKTRYSDYPWVPSDDGEENAAALLKVLKGEVILRSSAGQVTLEGLEGGSALTDVALFKLDDDEERIIDPWGNPYQFFYVKQGSRDNHRKWSYPSFVLVSPGPDGELDNSDYVTGNLPNDTRSHFENGAPENADNMVYGYGSD